VDNLVKGVGIGKTRYPLWNEEDKTQESLAYPPGSTWYNGNSERKNKPDAYQHRAFAFPRRAPRNLSVPLLPLSDRNPFICQILPVTPMDAGF
jgi:hypothetical protein